MAHTRETRQKEVIGKEVEKINSFFTSDELHRRLAKKHPNIGIATVYRTIKLFEENNIIEKHEFKDGRFRYEEVPEEHHDHLIDIKSGKVIEFQNEAIEELQRKIAEELGYKLVDHRLELYGVPDKAKK